MHLVNAQFATGDMAAVERMTSQIARVLDLVGTSLGVSIAEESLDVARFVTHLRYLFTRLERGSQIQRTPSGMAEAIRREAPEAYTAAAHVRGLMAMDGWDLSDDEVAYLALHISRLSDRPQAWDAG